MTWSADLPMGNESYKIRWEVVRYTRGRGIDLGCGVSRLFPHWIGVDNRKDTQLFGQPMNPDITVETAEKLDVFASQSMDWVFSSHLLEHIPYERVPATLKEWMRVLKVGGHLTLYLPDEDEYPKIGEPGANEDHQWNVSYEKVIEAMREGWDLIDFQKRNGGSEYSLYFVFRKTGSGQHFSWQKPKPGKMCAVVRYGAVGDLVQASSVLAGLKAQGYHITLFTSPPQDEVVRFDPNIDEFYLQGKDQVPNSMLGEFWDYQRAKYDKWVQLSESVEGSFLAMPGRAIHGWPPALRHSLLNRNYLEVQHAIAGIPYTLPQMRFYPTEAEKHWARKERAKLGPFVIGWALHGSSVHKTYGGLDHLIAATLLDFPDTEIVLLADEAGQILEQGWENEPRVHCRSGRLALRESLTLLTELDMAIGPETGLMNAVAMLPMPKVVFLSHSTHENLTRDWRNVYPLSSENTHCPGRGENEAPACHQMHYGWQHCKRTESGLAQCQVDIAIENAYAAVYAAITDARNRKGLTSQVA